MPVHSVRRPWYFLVLFDNLLHAIYFTSKNSDVPYIPIPLGIRTMCIHIPFSTRRANYRVTQQTLIGMVHTCSLIIYLFILLVIIGLLRREQRSGTGVDHSSGNVAGDAHIPRVLGFESSLFLISPSCWCAPQQAADEGSPSWVSATHVGNLG